MEKELEVTGTEEVEINPETVTATDVVVSDEEKEEHE